MPEISVVRMCPYYYEDGRGTDESPTAGKAVLCNAFLSRVLAGANLVFAWFAMAK